MNKNTAENEALLELVGLAKKDKEDGRVASSSEFKRKYADELLNKGMTTILSCKTYDQLINAISFCNLIYRRIGKDIGMVNKVNMHSLFERSIGYAQCNIKSIKGDSNE